MVEWLAYIPYLLVAGYFCSAVTIVIYLIIKRFLPQYGAVPGISGNPISQGHLDQHGALNK
jgi:hypothetical protein